MAASPAPSHALTHFGAFEVDLRARELRKNGLKVRLQEQPFQILVMLLARPGEVVARDEVQQRLWPADTFVDFNHGVNNAVNRLREALGDSAENPKFVETVPRRGYRFVGAVTDDPAAVSLAVPADVGAIAVPVSGGHRPVRVLAASVVVGLLGVLIGLNVGGWRQRLLARVSPTRIQSVVVLPFENLTGDPAQEYFADGMTDSLITELAQTQALRVISRTSAMQYKGIKRVLPQVAKELNVDAVVEGTVRRSGDRVWITAQLIDATGDRHLWAKSYERELRDIPALQSEMARGIVSEMHVELTAQERARLAHPRPVNAEAYDSYLRGRFYAASENKDDLEKATRLLERAIAIDPEFALAHAALARTYLQVGRYFKPQQMQWRERGIASVNKALALEPDLAEAHLAKASAFGNANPTAIGKQVEELHRAIALNPNLDEAHHLLGSLYNHFGLLDKAHDELQRAIAINPANTGARYRIGINLLFQGKYDAAVTVFDGTRRFTPSLWGFHMAFALFHLGRIEDARAVVNQSLRELPRDDGGLLASVQAMLAAAAGDERGADEGIQRAIAIGTGFGDFHHTEYAIASSYALLSKPEAAVTWLQKAADDGLPCYPLFERDTSLDHLRQDAGFIAFMATLKKQWEQYRATL